MKPKILFGLFATAALLCACNNDMTYVSNDPKSAPNAPECYDVNDLYQNYTLFYKPSNGWVGDPMPFYKDGVFHIFYLHDARDGKATFHPWYKTTTTDFSTYTDAGEMIACGTENEQDGALGTGSVFEHNGVYYAFYTGHNGNLDPREKILLATSTDLKNWVKDKTFELRASDGYDRNEFRDPIILKEGDKFKMLLSTRADYKGSWRAVLAQYSSTDLRNWTLETPFYDNDKTFMIECADVFEMGGYQYLIYSDIDDRMVHYQYRRLGTTEWTIPVKSSLDGREFYAAKTVSGGSNRYLMGWTMTREGNNDYTNYSWAGSLVVHQLIQNQDGTLYVTIPSTISSKLANEQAIEITGSAKSQSLSQAYTLSAVEGEQDYITFGRLQQGPSRITATIKTGSATTFGFEFGACGNRRETFAFTFNTTKQELQLNRVLNGSEVTFVSKVALPAALNGEYNVTIFTENSVCTLYLNNEAVFSSRIYKMNQNPWGIFSNNGDVTFSDIKLYK